MTFILLTLVLLVVLFLIMVATARMFQDHSVADLLDWKPTRSPEVEAQNEVNDVRQMIEAQNEYRRKRGAEEITEADVQRQALEDEALRARGRGPFAPGGGLDDDVDEEALPPKRQRRTSSRSSTTKSRSGKSTAGKRNSTRARKATGGAKSKGRSKPRTRTSKKR
jgi:hypothetical protein